MNKPKTIQLMIDANASNHLYDNDTITALLTELKKNTNSYAIKLYETLKARNILYHETSIVEISGLDQFAIHENLENLLTNTYSTIKKEFHCFYKNYIKSSKNDDDKIAIGTGFSKVMEILYQTAFDYLLNTEALFSKAEILKKLKGKKRNSANKNLYVNDFYRYATLGFTQKRTSIASFLAIESIPRFCKNFISASYGGDKEINELWCDYITSSYFSFWENKYNINVFRSVAEQLRYINHKHKLDFFPTDILRPYDDSLDGQIVHALSFGWYQTNKELKQIAVLTADPFDKVISRVKQCQAYLSYCQNPISPTGTNIMPKISHSMKPGVLYHLDMNNRTLKCVEFYPVKITINDDKVQFASSTSDIIEMHWE